MGKFLLNWDLQKWISCSKGEGISHGTLCSFPRFLPQLSMKQRHFASHGNTQDNSQVQELLPAPGCPESSQGAPVPVRKDCQQSRTSADRGSVWFDPGNKVRHCKLKAPCAMAADRSWWELLLCQDINSSVRELGLLPCPNQDLSATNSQTMPPRKGKVFSLPVATKENLKF